MRYRIRPYDPGIPDFDVNAKSVTGAANEAAARMYGARGATGVVRQDGQSDAPGHFLARGGGDTVIGRMFHVSPAG